MTGPTSREGTQFGPYRLRRLIGRGGMGEVYEAEDTVKDRIVALKLLPEGVSHDPVFRKRLQREAHSAGRLQEPHVVPIHDYGEIDGVLYVDMRMINGHDLRKLLKASGPMPPARAVAIIRQVAAALDAAHESGIMHRDVKPENILITRDDFAYLVDFGIANAASDEKLTELGTAVGTYAYMAPERFTSGAVTHRADVYALTCVLHECLTGGQPFPGDSVSMVITAHLMNPVPAPSTIRPGIPTAFDAVIARGMAKRPEDRFATAGALAAAATEALSTRDQTQAADIVARGEAATRPAPRFGTPTPYPTTPPPPARFYTPPPSGPTWNQQPPNTPGPGKKTAWVPIAAAAGVFVLVIAALGVFWLVKPDDTTAAPATTAAPTSTKEPVETTETTEPAGSTESESAGTLENRLLGMLPRDYAPGTCQVVHPPVTGALATVDCGPATSPGGPAASRYSLFADQGALSGHFDDAIKGDSELLQCPGSGIDSPTTWHYTDSAQRAEGSIACGTYADGPDITWTKNSDLMIGNIQAPDMEQLHQWWLAYG
ncbi:serine/threonine protein kinase [Mycolicibacterium cosmeticum]|uniref:non-specific serine/threonine protein kinase n=1 Tax=Mycolicibacterium cosmeticum TaxID=258533 RepID=W9BJ32_MYCCO|nr:serine/threonine-protein kinase [Mycolicibacterium cosmeticum]TLH68071.1 serine/threonine protein kinase [Mycolicibacterium cosmeticum]CDO06855.1 serine/threonine protein kinase [Mycolicibacterium cosmeticum]